jgi:hypothetical protein
MLRKGLEAAEHERDDSALYGVTTNRRNACEETV